MLGELDLNCSMSYLPASIVRKMDLTEQTAVERHLIYLQSVVIGWKLEFLLKLLNQWAPERSLNIHVPENGVPLHSLLLQLLLFNIVDMLLDLSRN
jgi:hypothetical protein